MLTKQKNSSWVDFDALKRNVSFLTILEHYNIVNNFTRKGDKLIGSCPIHKGDSPTAFHIDLNKNVYKCFTRCKAMGFRGGGNIIDFVADMEKLGPRRDGIKKAADFIMKIIGQTYVASATSAPKPKPHQSENQIENQPLAFILALNQEHPYLKERGLTKETVEYFGLGYASKGIMKNRICIPIHDYKGNLVAYAGRALDDKSAIEGGKYKLPVNFHKSQVLFNFHRISDFETLILVEGFFDCFKVHQSGFKSVCAIMGSSISEFQEELILSYFKRVVLMFDADPAGRACTKAVLNHFYDKIFVRVAKLADKNQPDELTESEIQKILNFI